MMRSVVGYDGYRCSGSKPPRHTATEQAQRRPGISLLLLGAFSVALCLCGLPSLVRASSPTLSNILPRGGQRGTEAVLFFNGARLADAKEILLYYPGLAVTKLVVVNDSQVKVTVKIAPDCRLGEHALRVRTASGISELQSFYVGALPQIEEK